MNAAREGEALTLTFDRLERELLRHILGRIIANYRAKPEQLGPKAASAWYSTQGCNSVKMSAEETREWVESLRQYKSANAERLQACVEQISQIGAGQAALKISLEDASGLMVALNDHRLLLAARHDISQKEMDVRSLPDFSRLPAAQQTALSEIHLLAWIIEEILRFLPGDPGGWMETL